MIAQEMLVAMAVGLVVVTATALLVLWTWRWRLFVLSAQYVGVFILVQASWPTPLALTKLIAGWIAVLVLWLASSALPAAGPKKARRFSQPSWLTADVFPGAVLRFLAALMVIAAVISILPQTAGWLGSRNFLAVFGGLILLGLGVLHLGMSARPFGICLGLLTLSSGFEVLYAVVETSAMVAGLQAAINLGLSLAISYMLIEPAEESG